MCGPRSPGPNQQPSACWAVAPPPVPGIDAGGDPDGCGRRAHPRCRRHTPARATAIKTAARGWADFWDGRLDLDALAVDVTEHLTDLQEFRARVDRFTSHARQWWEHLHGDDPLILSLPGVGPATGPCIRAYFGDGSGFDSAKKAANYVGITPSNRRGPQATFQLTCFNSVNSRSPSKPRVLPIPEFFEPPEGTSVKIWL